MWAKLNDYPSEYRLDVLDIELRNLEDYEIVCNPMKCLTQLTLRVNHNYTDTDIQKLSILLKNMKEFSESGNLKLKKLNIFDDSLVRREFIDFIKYIPNVYIINSGIRFDRI